MIPVLIWTMITSSFIQQQQQKLCQQDIEIQQLKLQIQEMQKQKQIMDLRNKLNELSLNTTLLPPIPNN